MRRINSTDPWEVLSVAARRAGVCKRTLLRTYLRGRLTLKTPADGGGVWRVRWEDLRRAPLLSMGQAAKQLGVHVTTVRRWAGWGLVAPSKFRLAKSYRDESRNFVLDEIGARWDDPRRPKKRWRAMRLSLDQVATLRQRNREHS